MLYIICTPIGNLNDFSVRSINTLKEVDNIFVEDTRVSSKLLKYFDIKKNTLPFHEHNEKETIVMQQRSICASSDLKAGIIIEPQHLDFLRPCPQNAIKPYDLKRVVGKTLKKNLTKGEGLLIEHLSK